VRNSRNPDQVRHSPVLALAAALCIAASASAGTLTVTPVSLSLGPRAASALLTLKNPGDQQLRYEVSVATWSEDEHGEMVLLPTDDIVVFPLLSSLPPHSEKTVRVGLIQRGAAATERTYRVFFQEMKPPQTESGDAAAVMLLMRIGIPVFVAPPKSSGSAVLEPPTLAGGHLHFRLSNPGNAHIRLQKLTVTSETPGGMPISHELKTWYLLAGGTRVYDLALDAKECGTAQGIRVEARWQGGSVSGRVPVAAHGCA